jgi:hypothetical protein
MRCAMEPGFGMSRMVADCQQRDFVSRRACSQKKANVIEHKKANVIARWAIRAESYNIALTVEKTYTYRMYRKSRPK